MNENNLKSKNLDWRNYWSLDRRITFLNHGSFGATPIPVLEYQTQLRQLLESEPVRFFRELESLLDRAREELASFIGADSQDLVFLPNATAGVNTVLRSLTWRSDEEILIVNYTYNACQNAVNFIAQQTGAKVAIASIPFPLNSREQIVEAVVAKVSPQTKLALLDCVNSPTALVFPVTELVKELAARGVDTLVDGAHAPGCIDLDLRAIGATYFTGNCHKWLCAPKGAAFLYVRRDRQFQIRPLVISHGANSPRKDRSRFHLEFDWMGTDDPTPYLCVPEAIKFMDSLLPRGWSQLRKQNHELVLEARSLICELLEIEIPCPDDTIGSMASIPLPEDSLAAVSAEMLQKQLIEEYQIEVPVIPWSNSQKLLRISAQIYNRIEQYEFLARTLKKLILIAQ